MIRLGFCGLCGAHGGRDVIAPAERAGGKLACVDVAGCDARAAGVPAKAKAQATRKRLEQLAREMSRAAGGVEMARGAAAAQRKALAANPLKVRGLRCHRRSRVEQLVARSLTAPERKRLEKQQAKDHARAQAALAARPEVTRGG